MFQRYIIQMWVFNHSMPRTFFISVSPYQYTAHAPCVLLSVVYVISKAVGVGVGGGGA